MASLAILGDWGTTRLRLHLCDVVNGVPRTIGRAIGPGVKETTEFESALATTVQKLPSHGGVDQVVLTGMVGSNIGWRDAGYVRCPFNWHELFDNAIHFKSGKYSICIVPGAACTNRFGYPDYMRGEETQILGWIKCQAESKRPRLACLPGTHTKWAIVNNGKVTRFDTSVQGEMFDILRHHSVLTGSPAADRAASTIVEKDCFNAGVDLLRNNPDLSLTQALFATRSLQIAGTIEKTEASSFLSGLLIAADVRDIALSALDREKIEKPIVLIGEPSLTALYSSAFDRFNVDSELLDGDTAVLAGLSGICAQMNQAGAVA